eukprot:6256512-Prymnesium_polylepis.1
MLKISVWALAYQFARIKPFRGEHEKQVPKLQIGAPTYMQTIFTLSSVPVSIPSSVQFCAHPRAVPGTSYRSYTGASPAGG